jgi:hypothetical protein
MHPMGILKVRDVGWTDGRTYTYVMFLESVGIRL